jgi:GTPase Era involved in 16S rRNA processing
VTPVALCPCRLNNTNTPIIVAINKVDLLHHQTTPPSNASSSSSRSLGDVHPLEQLQRLWAALLPQAGAGGPSNVFYAPVVCWA